jgi:hypothetical protein
MYLAGVLQLLGLSQRVLEHHSPAVDAEVTSRLPVPNATRAFWTHSAPDANPLAAHGSAGQLTNDADVCIVGSGITGVSAAYHLGRLWTGEKKLKTVVFEARDFCECSAQMLSMRT